MCFRQLIVDSFIPPEEKSKALNRALWDEERETWRLKPYLFLHR